MNLQPIVGQASRLPGLRHPVHGNAFVRESPRRLARQPTPFAFERSAVSPRPEGTTENSPAFKRWVWMSCGISPEGTAEARSVLPSRRELGLFGYRPGVEAPGDCHPSLQHEAIQPLVAMGVTPASLLGGQ